MAVADLQIRGASEKTSRQYGNDFGETFVAGGLPPYTEWTRKGRLWSVYQANAAASLVVRPSTVAALTIFNNESGKVHYVIDRIFAVNLVSTAAESSHQLWACVHKQMTKPTADIAAANIRSGTGKGYSGSAVVDEGATVNDDGWFPWGSEIRVAVAAGVTAPKGFSEARVEGRMIIPPQAGLSLQVSGTITGNTFMLGASWFEIELELE